MNLVERHREPSEFQSQEWQLQSKKDKISNNYLGKTQLGKRKITKPTYAKDICQFKRDRCTKQTSEASTADLGRSYKFTH